MATVGLRTLSRETRKVIEQLEESREPVLILRRGKPIAALVAVDGENLNQLLIEGLPEFIEERRQADEELGDAQTRPLAEVMKEIEANEPESEDEPPGENEESFHNLLLAWRAELENVEMATALGAPSVVESEPAELEEIGALNQELLRRYLDNALLEAFRQVRDVNANLADALRREGKFSTPGFRALLEQVTGVERLTHPIRAGAIAVNDQGEIILSSEEAAVEERALQDE